MSALDVNDLIGKPWQRDARGPDAFDCWGLTREILQRLRPGESLPDWLVEGMTRQRQAEIMAGASTIYGDRIEAMEHGALVLVPRLAHIAIVVGRFVITTHRKGGAVAVTAHDFAARFPAIEVYRWRA
jgi:cell wall-associated NlpC family hydrolase